MLHVSLHEMVSTIRRSMALGGFVKVGERIVAFEVLAGIRLARSGPVASSLEGIRWRRRRARGRIVSGRRAGVVGDVRWVVVFWKFVPARGR